MTLLKASPTPTATPSPRALPAPARLVLLGDEAQRPLGLQARDLQPVARELGAKLIGRGHPFDFAVVLHYLQIYATEISYE